MPGSGATCGFPYFNVALAMSHMISYGLGHGWVWVAPTRGLPWRDTEGMYSATPVIGGGWLEITMSMRFLTISGGILWSLCLSLPGANWEAASGGERSELGGGGPSCESEGSNW